jgi:hypothetical protein
MVESPPFSAIVSSTYLEHGFYLEPGVAIPEEQIHSPNQGGDANVLSCIQDAQGPYLVGRLSSKANNGSGSGLDDRRQMEPPPSTPTTLTRTSYRGIRTSRCLDLRSIQARKCTRSLEIYILMTEI